MTIIVEITPRFLILWPLSTLYSGWCDHIPDSFSVKTDKGSAPTEMIYPGALSSSSRNRLQDGSTRGMLFLKLGEYHGPPFRRIKAFKCTTSIIISQSPARSISGLFSCPGIPPGQDAPSLISPPGVGFLRGQPWFFNHLAYCALANSCPLFSLAHFPTSSLLFAILVFFRAILR